MGADENASEIAGDGRSRERGTSLSDARRLVERIKELECLYAIADLVENQAISFEEMLQGIAASLPPAFQYPDITAARLRLDAKVFETAPLDRLPPGLSAPLKVREMERGRLDVFYLGERPAADEGPFLYEERRLLDAVAERVGRVVERHEAQETLAAQQAFMNDLFDALNDVLFVVDLEGRMVRWNRMVNELAGYTDDEIARMTAWDFFDPDSVERGKQTLLDPSHAKSERLDAVMRTREGRRVDMEFTGAVLRNSLGQVVNVCGIGRDVTARRRVEEAVRKSEEKFRTMFNNVGDAIFVISPDGPVLDANQAAVERYGYTHGELLRMRHGDFRADSHLLLEPPDMDAIATNEEPPRETVHKRKDGTEFPVERLRRLIEYEGQDRLRERRSLRVLREVARRAARHRLPGVGPSRRRRPHGCYAAGPAQYR